MKKRNGGISIPLSILLSLCLLGAGELDAKAKRGGDTRPRDQGQAEPWRPIDAETLQKSLGLSETQTAEIQKVHDEYIITMDTLHTTLLREKQRLYDLMLTQEDVDLQEVRTRLQTIAGTQADIQFAVIKHHFDVDNILTPEQREKHHDLILKTMRQRQERGQEQTY